VHFDCFFLIWGHFVHLVVFMASFLCFYVYFLLFILTLVVNTSAVDCLERFVSEMTLSSVLRVCCIFVALQT